MSRKPRFNPEITRVKLNPEQAVLQCTCFDRHRIGTVVGTGARQYCNMDRSRSLLWYDEYGANVSVS